MNRHALDLFVAGIDEEDAFQLLHAMRRKFHWAGSIRLIEYLRIQNSLEEES